MKLYKKIILLLICFLVIVITFYFGWPVYKKKFKSQELEQENVVLPTPSQSPEKIPQTRQELADYIAGRIDDFTPYPSADSSWQVRRFGFVDDSNTYVEIEDGHNLSKVLLSCKKQKDIFECREVVHFEPDNFQWKIDQGQDPFVGREIYYYEKKIGQWVFVGNSFEIRYFPISRDSLLEIQRTADQGYLAWRRDPISILRHDLPKDFNFDINRDKYKPLPSEDKEGKIIYQITFSDKSIWNVILIQPVKKGKGGIWVIEEMSKVK